MSILDIFKKIFPQPEPQKISESLSVSQLRDRLNLELKRNLDQQSSIRKSIESRLLQLSSELSDQISILKNLSLDKRKEDEKIKLLVRENLKLYINYLEKLSNDLKNIKEPELANYLSKVESIFNSFHKASQPAFEKATLLIGEDLGITKDVVNSCLKNIKSLTSENSKVFSQSNIISRIKSSFLELDKFDSIEKEIENELQSLSKSKLETNEKLSLVIKKIEQLKASSAYVQTLADKEKRRLELEQIDLEISSIKDMIDLKALAKKYHNEEKKARVIAKYSENFKLALLEDKNIELNDLIKQDLYKTLLLLQAKLFIKEDVPEIDKKISGLEEEISNLKSQIISLDNSSLEARKKQEKIKENREEILKNIKNQALLLNLEII